MPKSTEQLSRYLRTAHYLAGAQIYLQDNVLLREPLKPEHIKKRLLGHWGTCPGINLVYTQLNRAIQRDDRDCLLVTGPGHGAPANLANLYLEGSLQALYPHLTRDAAGLQRFVGDFSWPGRFPSHLYPGLPGTIHEGGELGYGPESLFTEEGSPVPDVLECCPRGTRRMGMNLHAFGGKVRRPLDLPDWTENAVEVDTSMHTA